MIRHPTAFIQRSFARFLLMGHYGSLSRRLVISHRERALALAAALKQHMPYVSHTAVTGGSSLWMSGPDWLDCRQLAAAAKANRILIEPGDVYFLQDRQPLNFFRLSFSSIASDRINEGIRRLDVLAERQNPRTYRLA